MTVTPYVDMCHMDFIQFHSRKDNTEKKLRFTCINMCYAIIIIVVGCVFSICSSVRYGMAYL
jgi:hypothetical protein